MDSSVRIKSRNTSRKERDIPDDPAQANNELINPKPGFQY